MNSSTSSIMSVREMIDMAFGEPNKNVIDHKMIETILYLLARQLRILERRVEIDLHSDTELNKSSLSVSEIKLQATVPKRKRGLKSVVSGGQKSTTVKSGAIKKTVEVKPGAEGITPGGKTEDRRILDNSITDKGEMISSDKRTVEKISTEKSSDKSSSQKTSKEKSSWVETSTKKSSDEPPVAKSRTTGVKRADSREVKERTPTPMASIESIEIQYEKLLMVERVPSVEKEAQAAAGRLQADPRTPRISVVTQEDFMKLAIAVRDLQTRFGVTAMPDFPENIRLMQELRKGASLTDAMAALQLSARLEAAEKTLKKMISLVTELASATPGADRVTKEDLKTEVIFDGAGYKSQMAQQRKGMSSKKQIKGPLEALTEDNVVEVPSEGLPTAAPADGTVDLEDTHDFITSEELNSALKEVYDDLIKVVRETTNRNKINAENALKMANRLEGRLNASLDIGDRMNNLETLLSEYAEQVNILDTGLSSQMTNYQEQLTQMQHNLEGGLEAMAEALASAGGDTAAVAELNKHFTDLQSDFETTKLRQKDLTDNQTSLSMDLQDLWTQLENLRETKSDREEVADAFRDKAGLEALNGLVSLEHFNAVRGDLEKRIVAAYDKFNNQEIIWQKVIDDLLRELADKADFIQVATLRDNINSHLEKLRCKIQGMLDIVGEPKAAAISRRLHRDSACLSCSSPAHMAIEESTVPILPALPAKRPPALGAEDISKPKESGDHGICYTGLPIPHFIDTRAHVCNRYCGGSHTRLNNVLRRAPPEMIINSVEREFTTDVGTVEKTSGTAERKPCIPCNRLKIDPPPAELSTEDKVVSEPNTNSDMTPSDFRHPSIGCEPPQTQEEAPTPPMHIEEYC